MSKKATLAKLNEGLSDKPQHKKEKDKKDLLESNIPRGERADFIKTTITIPANLLEKVRLLGSRRKAAKMKDTDTSSLVREALVEFLNKHKSEIE